MKTSAENIGSATMDIASPLDIDTARNVAEGPVSAGSRPVLAPDALAQAATERWSHGLEWSTILWIGLLHVGALGALFVFTWKGLLLFLVLSWLTGGLGVCLGYHRLMAHLSFQTYPVVRRISGASGRVGRPRPARHLDWRASQTSSVYRHPRRSSFAS